MRAVIWTPPATLAGGRDDERECCRRDAGPLADPGDYVSPWGACAPSRARARRARPFLRVIPSFVEQLVLDARNGERSGPEPIAKYFWTCTAQPAYCDAMHASAGWSVQTCTPWSRLVPMITGTKCHMPEPTHAHVQPSRSPAARPPATVNTGIDDAGATGQRPHVDRAFPRLLSSHASAMAQARSFSPRDVVFIRESIRESHPSPRSPASPQYRRNSAVQQGAIVEGDVVAAAEIGQCESHMRRLVAACITICHRDRRCHSETTSVPRLLPSAGSAPNATADEHACRR